MGVIKRGILGGFSGRVANIIGSSWKGIAYMKSMPLSVANPQTAGQTTQRNAFSAVVAVASIALSEYIKPCWDRWAQGMSGYNEFVSRNVQYFVNGVLTVPTSLKASVGSLAVPLIDSQTADASTGLVTVDWDTTLTGNGQNTDEMFVLLWNQTQDVWKGYNTGVARSVGTLSVALDGMVVADVIYIYLTARRADGSLVSDNNITFASVVA